MLRQCLGQAFARVEVMRFIGYRVLTDVLDGKEMSTAASVSKLYWSEYHRLVTQLALDIEGLAGLITDGKGPSRFSRADDPGSDPASSNTAPLPPSHASRASRSPVMADCAPIAQAYPSNDP